MQITKQITIDLQRRELIEPLEAVQCDANSRAVKVTLLSGGESWTPPAGAVASVAFKKPDGTSGWYDKLPDGTSACAVSGNTVTAIFAPQMLTAAGKVRAAVIFQDSQLNQLATFVFTVDVQANPAAGKGISNDYYKYSTMEKIDAAVDAWLTETEAEKNDFISKADAALEAIQDVATTSENAPPIVCEESGQVISVSDSADRLLRGLTLYGKTTQNGTPTPTSPEELVNVGGDGSIGVSVAGGNLCNPNAFRISGGDVSKHLFVSDDGWLSFENATEYNNYPMVTIPVPTGDYTVSVEIASITGNTGVYFSKTKSDYSKKHTSGVTGFLTDTDQIWIAITGKNGATAKIRITINAGNTALPFELYKSQTLTVSTPNGLAGVPIASGGNYTDENGQQWVCDEIDFARGVYVKRVGVINGYAGESISGPFMSATGDLTTGAKVLYALGTPTETTLSAQEMAAYYALHSNMPNTTVFNDAGAGMKLGYVADTKLYIDNKFNELATALVNKT